MKSMEYFSICYIVYIFKDYVQQFLKYVYKKVYKIDDEDPDKEPFKKDDLMGAIKFLITTFISFCGVPVAGKITQIL